MENIYIAWYCNPRNWKDLYIYHERLILALVGSVFDAFLSMRFCFFKFSSFWFPLFPRFPGPIRSSLLGSSSLSQSELLLLCSTWLKQRLLNFHDKEKLHYLNLGFLWHYSFILFGFQRLCFEIFPATIESVDFLQPFLCPFNSRILFYVPLTRESRTCTNVTPNQDPYIIFNFNLSLMLKL